MLYDTTAQLVTLFNRKAGRAVADAMSVAEKMERLTESQQSVVAQLATIYPQALVGPPLPMFTVDQKVWTFGTLPSGEPVVPFGKAMIYQQLGDIPDWPWTPGCDYLDEGTQIRIPNNLIYTGTLYWRGVVTPPDLSDTQQSVLYPVGSRELIVIDAVRRYAADFDRMAPLYDRMEQEWSGNGRRTGAWPTWCTTWRTQFSGGGAVRLSAWNFGLPSSGAYTNGVWV